MIQTKRCSDCDAILPVEADSAEVCAECEQRDKEAKPRPAHSTVTASIAQILQEEAARAAVLDQDIKTAEPVSSKGVKKFQIGFRIGFYSTVFIGLLAFFVYIFSMELRELWPEATPVLIEHTAAMDVFFDTLAGFLVPPIVDIIWAWHVILETIETIRLWTTGLGSSSRAFAV